MAKKKITKSRKGSLTGESRPKQVRSSASKSRQRNSLGRSPAQPRKKILYDAKDFAVAAAKIADERHCSNIVILDLRGLSPATDYFVIATGTSERQMRTVADEICQEARKQEQQVFGRAGYEQARWIVLDFIDVVVHIFDNEYRDYYDLELLWGDAKRISY